MYQSGLAGVVTMYHSVVTIYHSDLADVDDTHSAFHPPIAHRPPIPLPLILASLAIRRTSPSPSRAWPA